MRRVRGELAVADGVWLQRLHVPPVAVGTFCGRLLVNDDELVCDQASLRVALVTGNVGMASM